MARRVTFETPLNAGSPPDQALLMFHSLHGREELSRTSGLRVDLLSRDGEIKPDKVLGQNVTIKVPAGEEDYRFFNGYVTRFSQQGTYGRFHRYVAAVHPWLWFLTRTADCRIFQDMTVRQILETIFEKHKMTGAVAFELTGTYRQWTYCVQYRETDFNFVSRLMEHEGMYYYFRHTEGKNTLVITDSTSKHVLLPCEDLRFVAKGWDQEGVEDCIGGWEFSCEIQPGVYVHDDYDLLRPSVKLRTQKAVTRGFSPSDYEVFDYPGCYVEKPHGQQYAGVRIDELASQFEAAHAVTGSRIVEVGSLFNLTGHPREDQNREYLVLSTDYDLTSEEYEATPHAQGSGCSCRFTALSTEQQFRPRRITPKPFVQGPQTAVVVGPAGDEIHTDEYGRVKVQFHWDRKGARDAKSSCWIRVAHPWAGKGWGAVSTPRIGQEVIVDFLEGDPDQPIITGRVYNAECTPPFGFPAGAVISGVKSDTHKGNGYNEISLDDTAGTEKITIHGQYDMNSVIEHDQTLTVHNNRTDRVDVDDSESVGNNQKWDVGVNRDATIGSNETLTVGANRTKKIGANETITVGANRDSTVSASETATVMAQRTHTVGINETISVGAAQEITVGGLQAVTVGAAQTINVGANQSTDVGANQTNTIGANQTTSVSSNAGLKVGGNQAIDVTGGRTASIGKDDAVNVTKNFILDAGDSITIKTGDASITMKKDGTITIKGKDISIKGSGKVNVKADSDVVVKGSKVGLN
ncbi:MAG: type VI secretion system Vgr family protein [Vicinamibacterales bacterium]